jgi:hypothetical protein
MFLRGQFVCVSVETSMYVSPWSVCMCLRGQYVCASVVKMYVFVVSMYVSPWSLCMCPRGQYVCASAVSMYVPRWSVCLSPWSVCMCLRDYYVCLRGQYVCVSIETPLINFIVSTPAKEVQKRGDGVGVELGWGELKQDSRNLL